MKKLTLSGNTFSIKEELKAEGFRWNPTNKTWSKNFEDETRANELRDAYESNGVYGSISEVQKSEKKNEKKYFVKESWIFNLESMHDKLWVLENDIDEGRLQFPFDVAGKTIRNYSDLEDFRQECYEAEYLAKSGKVTGKEYGKIKRIVGWRVMQRYTACMTSGMEESKAAACFEDL